MPEVKALEKKIFTFNKDGSAKFVESKKGQSSPALKEDWEFNSWGRWELIGDTVYLSVNRFKAVRQEVRAREAQ